MGLLTRVFPADVVDAVVAAAGRTEQRQRALPARVVAYFAIGMALYSEGSYEDVFAQLTDGLSWTTGWEQSWSSPTKSAIFQARSRLGYEPLRDLFARVARPVAREDTPGSWLAGRRLVAIDGTCVDVPDTPENADFFGRPPSSRGEQSAFPQARLFAVAECGTHAMFDAVVGPCRTSEIELARDLAGRLEPGMLVLADRGLYGFKLWSQAAETGADLLWRVKATLRPRHLETLPDGSWLARIVATSGVNRSSTSPLNVRVVDYTIDDGRDNPEQYRLLTTILDPNQASATELAVLTRSVGKSRASSTNSNPINAAPGRCCARNPPSWCSRRSGGTRAATTPSARSCSTPPHTPGTTLIEYPSLRRYVSPEERYPTALFPPHNRDAIGALWQCAIGKLAQRLNPVRRIRANPRVVKRKVLKWAAKRTQHTRWPQPARSPQITIQLLN